jgi:hypothetical protein
LAVVFRAVVFLAVDFLAGAFLAVDLRAVVFLAVDFLAGARLAVDLRAVVFLAVDFLAGARLAVDFLAVDFLVAARADAVVRLTAALAAVDRFANGLRAVVRFVVRAVVRFVVLAAEVVRLAGDLLVARAGRRLVVALRVVEVLTGVMVVSLRLLLLGRLGGLLGRFLRRR